MVHYCICKAYYYEKAQHEKVCRCPRTLHHWNVISEVPPFCMLTASTKSYSLLSPPVMCFDYIREFENVIQKFCVSIKLFLRENNGEVE